ncbi:lipid IV(A) 3-deoxy-D-manno-octulosonic acid transferase [Psychrobium sp. MM17-31]|uniref:lipid IV(A) 3-deoxy-D-manno-octulosonic acid transferase n=1 Tax=Psychrobium sp. MM17-31 TaxID=2917758 RepID=UPI001EF4D612|nr:lipid IV(A) 3-deoxy-D-manno-octulosonic acid transferase [Psychrobium sp. MM17-31]MCG7533001.1 lipid IV(A) 3-deoxy-D-manno-octulosonic acid transferase [Psychrobium sp. MM17-31]
MNRFFYNVFMYLATPFFLLYLLYRALKSDDYRGRVGERFGFRKLTLTKPVILVHSVSVGETIAATPLIKQLVSGYPEHHILVTTSTPTGSEVVKKNFGDSVVHCYLPIDLPGSVKRFLKQVKPQAVIVMETELWPNLIHQLSSASTPILLANARMSEKSMNGYLGKAAPLMHEMLNKLDCVAAQYASDGERFVKLGLPEEKLTIGGSIKFELSISDELKTKQQALKQQWAPNRPVWVAGSTHPGENEQIFETHKTLLRDFPDLLLVVIPRHSERFDEVTQQASDVGFAIVRRSEGVAPNNDTQVVIGDTMGEMLLLLGISDISYIGGSLIERGGHNPLEPAALGKPVIMGPSCYNFSDICDKLVASGGLQQVANSDELAIFISQLLNDGIQCSEMGAKALQVVVDNQGTLARLMNWVKQKV